jgi:hypothetical protein
MIVGCNKCSVARLADNIEFVADLTQPKMQHVVAAQPTNDAG